MEEILEMHQRMEDDMNFRHPWFNMVYNYLVAICVLCLFASFVWWGIDIHTRKEAEAMTAAVLAEMDAEHEQMMAEAEAAERALLESEEHIMTEEAKVVAKAFYGIRRFVEKYGYTQADLETYARCMFNRADATGQSLEAVVSKKDQFLGYSENNQLVKEYYDFAIKFVNDWHNEEVKPCDISYQFAELEDDGIWLVKTFNADGKERRWKA
jgi:hypothetical protein